MCMPTVTRMTTTIDTPALLRLQSWLSPAFPVGAYAYSHALERAVEAGWVTDCTSLVDWLEADLWHGAGRMDGVFFAQAWRAADARDLPSLVAAAELAAAMRSTLEFALESTAQGIVKLTTTKTHREGKRLPVWLCGNRCGCDLSPGRKRLGACGAMVNG